MVRPAAIFISRLLKLTLKIQRYTIKERELKYKFMTKLDIILNKIEKLCKPVSIFLYGSRSRTDFLKRSDFEIGVLMKKSKYTGRSKIKGTIGEKGFNIYPFKYEDFIKGKLDTPFQKSIYLREIVEAGKTLRGKEIVENMKAPVIKVIDIIQDLRFNLGYAFASMHSYRNNDKFTASYEFYKSCMFGLRDLEILKLKKFVVPYDDIYKLSKKLKLNKDYKDLVYTAYKARQILRPFQYKDIFTNISFSNEFIEPQIVNYFKKNGNKVLIK
jgi:predicted nucleotidyltransferase